MHLILLLAANIVSADPATLAPAIAVYPSPAPVVTGPQTPGSVIPSSFVPPPVLALPLPGEPVTDEPSNKQPINKIPATTVPIATASSPAPATAATAPDVAVVCPAEFMSAMKPWVDFRTAQGRRITFIDAAKSGKEIREELIKLRNLGALTHVLLVGDADVAVRVDPAVRARSVPILYRKAQVISMFGPEKDIAGDNGYADLDGDHAPDLAIGRLPADTPEELARMIAKILNYERSRDMGPWRQKINFVAGVGGFGPLVDPVLETTARKILAEGIPASYDLNMTYGSWRSPFCPDPRQFQAVSMQRLTEGCLFWVYIGHGLPRGLETVNMPNGDYPIFGADDLFKLPAGPNPAIALMLACYTGAFDAPQDCLAEELLKRDGAPVAVIAGSRTTMPYAMSVLGLGMLEEVFQSRRATLGEVVMHAKRKMLEPAKSGSTRATLDFLAKFCSPKGVDNAIEREEHAYLFNLLGDPLLSLRHPQAMTVKAAKKVARGGVLEVEATLPAGPDAGKPAADYASDYTVELICGHDRSVFTLPARTKYEPGSLAGYMETYGKSNQKQWAWFTGKVNNGQMIARLMLPAAAHGECHVRVVVRGEHQFAVGTAKVVIE